MAFSEALACDSPCSEMDEHQLQTHGEVFQTPRRILGSGGIAEALRSVASADTWSLQGVFLQTTSLLCVGAQASPSSKPDCSALDCGQDEDKRCMDSREKTQEETFEVKFESKYVNSSVPLYQEYWFKCMKAEIQKAQQKKFVDVVVAQCRASMSSPPSPNPGSASGSAFEQSPPAVHVAPYALWQELPEVKRQNLMNILMASDVRLQEAIFELIVSEASYQKSLRVGVGLFHCSAELKQTLTPVQYHVLFSNLKEVCKVSEGFLLDLETQLGHNVVMSKIGDAILSHQSEFRRVYVPYVTNMMYQEALVEKLLQENRKFVLALKKLEKDPLCQRQTLKSFLILPFQRITRLRLILENILKRTDNLSTDVPSLKEAIEAVRQIVVECDANVQRMKQTEELVGLGKLVDFGTVKSVPLVISGRYLIKAGPLKKFTVKSHHIPGSVVSRTDVHLHLFNDLLLLSVKNGNRFSVQNYAVFPAQVRVKELKSKFLGLPSDAFLLLLTQNHSQATTAVTLAAQTRLENVSWLQLLSSQKGTAGNWKG